MKVPTEHEEQVALMQWAGLQAARHPELSLLHAIPNGGHRSKAQAGKLRAEGVKAGVPDLFLPAARNGRHGLYIELKRQRGGKLGDEQAPWHAALRAQGYEVVVAKGWEAAAEEIARYLDDPGRVDDSTQRGGRAA